jgi:uncharacterized membrane protein
VIIFDIATYAHVPWALGLQFFGWAIARTWGGERLVGIWLGAFAGAVMAVTREVTQAEYRWIEAYGHGLRRNMPDLAGFYVWEWNAHSIAETMAALLAVTAVAAIVTERSPRMPSRQSNTRPA